MKGSRYIIIGVIALAVILIGFGIKNMSREGITTGASVKTDASSVVKEGDEADTSDGSSDDGGAENEVTAGQTEAEDVMTEKTSEKDGTAENGSTKDGSAEAEVFMNYADEEGKVSMPETVTKLPDNIYADNSMITAVDIPETVTTIGSRAVSNTSVSSITIPASVTEISADAFSENEKLTEIKVAQDNTVYSSEGGCLYSADGKTLITVPGGLESVTIPAKVTEIKDGAISGNTTTIYGKIDTPAEEYAVANDLIFIAVE